MKKSKRTKKTGKKDRYWPFVLVMVVLFSAGMGGSYYYLKDIFAFKSDFIEDIESRMESNGSKVSGKKDLRLYGSDKSRLNSEDRSVMRKDTLLVVAEDIIRKFIKPYKVRLLDLYMDKQGVIYIDLGDEIIRNFQGDATEEVEILSGLFSGIKSTIPGFTALKILIEGREAESFGGHIDISMPIGEDIARSF